MKKSIKNISLFLLLCGSLIQFSVKPSSDNNPQETSPKGQLAENWDRCSSKILPEAQLSEIWDRCFSTKEPHKSLNCFIDEILTVINSNTEYFNEKHGEQVVQAFIAALQKVKTCKTPADVQKTLTKFSSLVPKTKKKQANPLLLLSILAQRLKNNKR